MLDYYIELASNLFTLIFYLVSFFLFIGIKRRTDERLAPTWRFLLIAVVNIIIARILNITVISELLPLPSFVKELFIFLFALFFLMATVDFYRYIVDFTNSKMSVKKPEVPCSDGIHKTISTAYKRKLNVMNEKIKGLERKTEKKNIHPFAATGIKNRLGFELSSLEKAYKEGYISRSSYMQGKTRIQNAYKKLGKNIYK